MTPSVQRFECPGCGAEVDLAPDLLSQVCAFCETPLVRSSDTHDEPIDAVATFSLDARQAGGRLQQFLAGRWFAPEAVRTASTPDELRAVLVPFWVYNATARSNWRSDIGIWWYETKTKTVMRNGKPETRVETVRHTEWHTTSGTHVHAYTDHLVSGSRGLPEHEANALEPFDLGRTRPFHPSLLAGMVAEQPSVDHAEAERVARQELADRERGAIRGFLPGDEVRNLESSTEADIRSVRLVLLPVWIATYPHKGATVRLCVNGQTGEVVGRVPQSYAKVFGLLAVLLVLGMLVVGMVVGVEPLLNAVRGVLR